MSFLPNGDKIKKHAEKKKEHEKYIKSVGDQTNQFREKLKILKEYSEKINDEMEYVRNRIETNEKILNKKSESELPDIDIKIIYMKINDINKKIIDKYSDAQKKISELSDEKNKINEDIIKLDSEYGEELRRERMTNLPADKGKKDKILEKQEELRNKKKYLKNKKKEIIKELEDFGND